MNVKSFLFGVVTGIVLTFATIFVIGMSNQNSVEDDPIQYLEKPLSYENKTSASFKVIQVLGNAALANEASDRIGREVSYYGNTVLILGDNFYSDQKITIKNPQRVGTYSYTAQSGMPKTVPVLEGEIVE